MWYHTIGWSKTRVSHTKCSADLYDWTRYLCSQSLQDKATGWRLTEIKTSKFIPVLSEDGIFRENGISVGRSNSIPNLSIKVIPIDAVHDELVWTFAAKAVADSTVNKYLRSTNFVSKKDGVSCEPAAVESSSLDEAILTVLADYPFSYVHELLRGIRFLDRLCTAA
jgi:hypothetical protein